MFRRLSSYKHFIQKKSQGKTRLFAHSLALMHHQVAARTPATFELVLKQTMLTLDPGGLQDL